MGDNLESLATGDLLRFMRERSGFSQRGLSAALGRNPSFMGIVENPSRDPSLSTVCRVASACGLGLEVYERSTGAPVARVEAPGCEE